MNPESAQPLPNPDRNKDLSRYHVAMARIRDLADEAIIAIDHEHSIFLTNQGAEKVFGYRVPGEASDTSEAPGPDSGTPLTIAQAARWMTLRSLERCGNNQTQAAVELGVTRDVLRHRMKKYGLLKPSLKPQLKPMTQA